MLLKRLHQKKAEIDIIPMVDIVFQLIIFFLVATQVKKNEATALQLPAAREAKTVKDETPPIIINILNPSEARKAKGEGRPYVVYSNYYDLETLELYLREQKQFNERLKKDMPMIRIRGDKDSLFKEIQGVLDTCGKIGIWEIRLTAQKIQK